jgi:hypothetical protein
MLFLDCAFCFWMISIKNVVTKDNDRLSYPNTLIQLPHFG